jgi:hypothetical protein
MPSRLGLALLGLTVGGATFLFSGVAAFLSIASLQDRAVISLQDRTVREARAPVAVVHYVEFQPRSSSISPADDCGAVRDVDPMQKNKAPMFFPHDVMASGFSAFVSRAGCGL